jgi:hypothetical protein
MSLIIGDKKTMPLSNIVDRYVNADWSIPIEVDNLPPATNATSATLVIKSSLFAPDAPGIITKTITTVLSSSGQIVQTGTDAVLTFLVPRAESAGLTPRKPLYYRAYMTTVNGASPPLVDVVADGAFVPQ